MADLRFSGFGKNQAATTKQNWRPFTSSVLAKEACAAAVGMSWEEIIPCCVGCSAAAAASATATAAAAAGVVVLVVT